MVFYGKPISLGLAKCEFFARIYHLGPVPPKALKISAELQGFRHDPFFLLVFLHFLDNIWACLKIRDNAKQALSRKGSLQNDN